MTSYTVAALIEAVYEQFQAAPLSYGHGTDNAWDEATALVLRVLGADDSELSLTLKIPQNQVTRILSATRQRVQTRQPLAYILGACQYMGLEFEVQPGVVVPRSPIGYLLHDGLAPWLPQRVENILDLCSGCGCLGIIAAHLYPQVSVTLLELDPVAVSVARRNVIAHGLQDRVQVVAGDVTAEPVLSAAYDLILCNPPYVDASGMKTLPAEFRAEPRAGLAAGEDGLKIIDAVLEQLPGWLAKHGLFVGEVGASAPALLVRHHRLPFVWPDLPLGGEGVFILEADALTSHTSRDL